MPVLPNEEMSNDDAKSLIHVLIVHPLRVERVRLIRPLRAHFVRNVEIAEAATADEALEQLAQRFFDVALVAQNLGEDHGLELAARFAELSPETATLLVADEDTPTLAAQVAQSAACDHLVRGKIDDQQLAQAISGAIRQIHLQRDYRQMVRRMNESHDQMDHLIRALSHDMNANFMLMENSFSKLQRSLDKQRSVDQDRELKEVASHVRACMTESRRFLNDLVGLARTGRVEMEPELIDTDSVVKEVLFEQRELFAQGNVAVDVTGPLPRLWCNRHRLKQVLTNLVRNAVKHGTDSHNPRITISGTNATEDRGMASVRIHDNGPGIPPQWHEEIFMPGRRMPNSEAEGSGMGLAIVRKIVQHYGGSVHIESGSESGTAFDVELPSVNQAETCPETPLTVGGQECVPTDRRLDHDTPHDDPRLHPHRHTPRLTEPERSFSSSEG